MQARKLLDAAPFEPETVEVLKQAFDAAWASIAPSLGPDRIDDTRLSLAHAIVAHAGVAVLGRREPQAGGLGGSAKASAAATARAVKLA
jgi:hypothetical protein